MATHKHRCGFAPTEYAYRRRHRVMRFRNEGKGCGLVWEHDDDMAGNQDAHRCPNCGVVTYCQYPGRIAPGRGVLPPALIRTSPPCQNFAPSSRPLPIILAALALLFTDIKD